MIFKTYSMDSTLKYDKHDYLLYASSFHETGIKQGYKLFIEKI